MDDKNIIEYIYEINGQMNKKKTVNMKNQLITIYS